MLTSANYGIETGMGGLRKITVEVPEELLGRLQEYTGSGVSETVRAALRKLDGERAQREFRKLRGSFKFSMDLNALREDRGLGRKGK